MGDDMVGPDDLIIARLTLALLHATLPDHGSVPMDEVVMLPEQQVLSLEKAAASLAALPKPLECWGSVVMAKLAVNCIRSSSTTTPPMLFAFGQVLSRFGNKMVRVESPSMTLTVRMTTLVDWLSDYRFPEHYAFRLRGNRNAEASEVIASLQMDNTPPREIYLAPEGLEPLADSDVDELLDRALKQYKKQHGLE